MNILELDLGNTRIKWRMLASEESAVSAEGVVNTTQQLLDSDFAVQSPDFVRLSNVRADDSVPALQQWISAQWQLETHMASVTSQCGGVINAYQDLSRMGVDRWLAMLAAYNAFDTSCLVVSAGTAVTIDLVTAGGIHEGGYILPGLSMMASALQANTGIRLQYEAAQVSTRPGVVTEEAVYNGSLASCAALIEKSAAYMGRKEASLNIVLSGGDAPVIEEALQSAGMENIVICPNLVLDGLAIAVPEPGEAASR